MYYGEIKKIDIANGLGVRVSLFVSGCRNKCPGCFNQMTWDFKYGKEFTKQTEDEIIEALKPDHIAGLTVLGGEPFEEENQRVLTPFLERVMQIYPQKNIWCYSGYVYDKDLLPKDGKKHCEVTDRMLACIDVLIDGPFIIELKDITLNYRGSSNQRILWLKEDKPVNSI
ncbi:anaerobic ribonucleoside-triphosphate reductase activating protein [Treponema pectinovorum]|uniref:anaerobic ribonucleoside-triphosphate reductase activating protein n=1 Tax=Treponema pectinovorum TaxID=164 RepID=UPI0011C78B7F|nr:anaerobic ribonucleoside-triphosphate reductase activating protein [Treponema pectinovorum]